MTRRYALRDDQWERIKDFLYQFKRHGLQISFGALSPSGLHPCILFDLPCSFFKLVLPGRTGTVGVTAKNNRLFVEAVLYRYRAGIPWRDLPERARRFPGGSYSFQSMTSLRPRWS